MHEKKNCLTLVLWTGCIDSVIVLKDQISQRNPAHPFIQLCVNSANPLKLRNKFIKIIKGKEPTAGYLWYVRSGALWEDLFPPELCSRAHEGGSHVVQPEQSHRHERASLGKPPITINS